MGNFIYNDLNEITICSALPKQKNEYDGIRKSISVFEQTTADLGFLAAQRIIESKNIDLNEIGILILFTKTPDYRGPATAMVLQKRLEIPQDCIVYDSPTGNGGFENALNLGASLLNAISKKYALVVCGDTVSKQLSDEDIKLLNFQDGATTILLEKGESSFPFSMSVATLSENWTSFMVPSGGFRDNEAFFNKLESKRDGQINEHLHIDLKRIIAAIKPELNSIKDKVEELIDSKFTSNFEILLNLLDPILEKEVALLFESEKYSDKIHLSSNYFPHTMATTIPLMIATVGSEKKQFPFQVISVSIGEGLCINISNIEIKESTILETIYSDDYYKDGSVTHEM
jgi:3-oxoacyl-[acyl-carrier-protein] synthase-3